MTTNATQTCSTCEEVLEAGAPTCDACGTRTTPASLFELIEEAQSALSTYKHPNVSEVQKRLHELLMAGQLGGILHDKLDDLSIRHDVLKIQTSYSVRSCEQTAEFEIPMSIVESADPMEAMKVWAKQERIKKAQRKLEQARQQLRDAEEELAEAANS